MLRCAPRITRFLFTALVAAATSAALGCATAGDWEQVRRDSIDPIHRLLHHSYPEAFQSANQAVLKAFFAEDAGPE